MSALHAVAGDRTVYRPTMDRTIFGGFDRFDELSPRIRAMIHLGTPDDVAAHDVVIGHHCLPTLLAGREPGDIAVVLRAPRARLLSHYTFWRGWSAETHDSWAPYDASRRAAVQTWPEFLDDVSIAAQIDNVAARLLVGPHELIPQDDFIADTDVDAVAAIACERLGSLGFVDVVERGGDVWGRLGAWVGHELDVGRRNETADESGLVGDWPAWLTVDASIALHRRTRIDRAVWDRAALAQIDQIGDSDEELAALADSAFAGQVARVAARGGARPGPADESEVASGGSARVARWRDRLTRR
jgi:hypothetical protein